jgi:hypothetical protein
VIVAEKGYVGRELTTLVAERPGALILRRKRNHERGHGPHLAPIRRYVESIFWTLKDRVGLERRHTRTPSRLARQDRHQLLALAAGI